MTAVGRVESLWRYPVKSMRGEELREAFVGFPERLGVRLNGLLGARMDGSFAKHRRSLGRATTPSNS